MTFRVIVVILLAVTSQQLSEVDGQFSNFTCDDEDTLHFTENFSVLSLEGENRDKKCTYITLNHKDISQDEYQEPITVRAGDHDLVVGDNCDGAEIYDKYNFTDCTYPSAGNTTSCYNVRWNGHVELYCIKVLDQTVNEDGEDLGGYPTIALGGIGTDFVEIHLVSQEEQGMKFLVELYTRVLTNTKPPPIF